MTTRFPLKGASLFLALAVISVLIGGRGSLAKFTESRFVENLKPAKIDLHSHSYCSDGLRTPEVLVRMAKDLGLKYYALTDHDTVACLPRAIRAGQDLGVQIIPGIEISVEDDSVHILALGINTEHPGLLNLLEENRAARVRRARNIVDHLNSRGIDIRWKEDVLISKLKRQQKEEGITLDTSSAQQETEDQILSRILGSITRPDLAAVLIEKGYVKDRKKAFDDYLGDSVLEGAGTFHGPSFSRAINLIHEAGGVAILAHPHTIHRFKQFPVMYSGKTYPHFESVLNDFLSAGLDGVESYRSGWQNFTRQIDWIQKIAKGHARKSGARLYFTLGSDYHGYEDGTMGAPRLGNILVEPVVENHLLNLSRDLAISIE